MFWYSRCGRALSQIVEENNIDIIHAHFAWPEGFVASLAKRVTKRPLVISVWGYDVQSDESSGYGALSQRYTADAVSMALRESDAITVGADSHYNAVLRLVGSENRGKINFIEPPLNTKRFNPYVDGNEIRTRYGLESEDPVVLFARKLKPIYGVEYMIKAASLLAKEYPRVTFLLLYEGDVRPELRDLVSELGLDRNVVFAGHVSRFEIPKFYSASDLLCDPCVFGQGYATLEAFACGKPAVGFNMGQIRIKNGVNGLLVEPRNWRELAEKIALLIAKPDLRRELGLRGRKEIEDLHSFESWTRRMMQLYRALSEGRT
jgi:glycosyltransferase involved in cell wall biosynthesis